MFERFLQYWLRTVSLGEVEDAAYGRPKNGRVGCSRPRHSLIAYRLCLRHLKHARQNVCEFLWHTRHGRFTSSSLPTFTSAATGRM